MDQLVYHSKLPLKTKTLNLFRKFFQTEEREQFLIKKILDRKYFYLKFIPPEYLYKHPSWRNYDQGIRLRLDISNPVDHVKYFHIPEPGLQKFLGSISPHDNVVDIGANIGVVALEMAKKTSGKVICFEPSPGNFARLSENARLNNFPNLILRNVGIGSQKAVHKLYNVVENNPGMKRISTENLDAEFETIEIDTLQNQLAQLNIDKVHAMKIDVEGFEMEVLKGAEPVIRTSKPVMLIEIVDSNLRQQNASAKELFQFVRSWGYDCFKAHNMQMVSDADNFDGSHYDMLCVEKS